MESKLKTFHNLESLENHPGCQLVEVNAWKREPRSNEYDTPRDILNTFFGMFEPSGLIMNATDKTLHKKAASRCQQIEEQTQSTVFTDLG